MKNLNVTNMNLTGISHVLITKTGKFDLFFYLLNNLRCADGTSLPVVFLGEYFNSATSFLFHLYRESANLLFSRHSFAVPVLYFVISIGSY